MPNLRFTQTVLKLGFIHTIWNTLIPIYHGDPKATEDGVGYGDPDCPTAGRSLVLELMASNSS
jgi:hypothetical protein